MSLKQEIETWVKALAHYDNEEFEESLGTFDEIADTSKILFNCGVIHATLGEHGRAIECYQRAVRLDQYLAVAYFQQGVSNFLVGDFEEALANFNDTLLYLRGNSYIDYEQLGLKFKLYSCEVLFNRGLCYIYLKQKDAGMQDLTFAVKEKRVEDHNVIDDAIQEEADGYTVFSIPVGVVYRPNSAKVKNLKTKDYLGKARLVAASDRSNEFTGFAGSEIKRNGDSGKDDRPAEAISFAATNLVKPDLRSRTRQQSEPPINRQMFPPTPPPEAEKPLSISSTSSAPKSTSSMSGRAASVRNRLENRPEKLDLQTSNLHNMPAQTQAQPQPQPQERPRLGTMRTASEPRGPSRGYSNGRNPDYSFSRSKTDQTMPTRRRVDAGEVNGVEENSPDQVYDLYSNFRPSAPRRADTRLHQRHEYIEEENELESEGYDNSSIDEGDFEIVSQERSSRKMPLRASSRRPDVSKIRVKAHLGEDTRYIMIGAAIEFADLQDRLRNKFKLRSRFKCKVRDEEDMITLGDQDDLELAISTCKAEARRERSDMGKMELWVQEIA